MHIKLEFFFNVSYRTILAHLDTSKPTIQNGKLVLLFSRELSELDKKWLSDELKLSTNKNNFLWIYKEVEGVLVLINDHKPSFSSTLKASESLHISKKTIRKYIDSGKSYKGLYFYPFLFIHHWWINKKGSRKKNRVFRVRAKNSY